MNETAVKLATSELVVEDGKPLGSGLGLQPIDNFAINVFGNKQCRSSLYMKTPSRYAAQQCGLIIFRIKD